MTGKTSPPARVKTTHMLPMASVSPAPTAGCKRKITSIFLERFSDWPLPETAIPLDIRSRFATMEMKKGAENTNMMATPMLQHNAYLVFESRKSLL